MKQDSFTDILETCGLFHWFGGHRRLSNTDYVVSLNIVNSDVKISWWLLRPGHYVGNTSSFKEVFNAVPENIQKELIYHFDFFINRDYPRDWIK